MIYDNITMGRFISRPNRFIAEVSVNGRKETVHVKNTGRCRELLLPDSIVYLSASDNPLRKTLYDLVAVEKITSNRGKLLINMDSQAPNKAVEEWLHEGDLFGKSAYVRREYKWGDSRFDFFVRSGNKQIFLEVKGVTLEENGTALFPDAPTERGLKHIYELIKCMKYGYEAYILFVIQMKGVSVFCPNTTTHPEFAETLAEAERAGVNILAYDCVVRPDSMIIDSPVRIKIE